MYACKYTYVHSYVNNRRLFIIFVTWNKPTSFILAPGEA